MINKEYIENALITESKDFDSITNRFNHVHLMRVVHGAMGLCTESAEFLDTVKKHIFYGKFIDIVNIEEELGDLMWYMAIIMDAMHINPNSVMESNIAKLKKRYGDKFSEWSAINRNVEKEYEALKVAVDIVKESGGTLDMTVMPDGSPQVFQVKDFMVDKDDSIVSNKSRMHPSVMHIMQFFVYSHLPINLQKISKPFSDLAIIISDGPQNAETTTALRKLLEAKDCAVRSYIAKDNPSDI